MADKSNREKSCCEKLVAFVFTLGFLILIYWAIFQPHHIRATVDSAALSNLTVSNSTTSGAAAVSYRLAVGLHLYNPSLRVNVYYDALYAELWFRAASLGAAGGVAPAEFYQRRKSGDVVKVDFEGSLVVVPGDVARELEKEKSQGTVSLEVAVDAQVRYKFSTFKIRQKPRIRCWQTIPVKPEGGGGGAVGGAVAAGEQCSVKQ